MRWSTITDDYYKQRKEKQAFIEDLLKISVKHGYVLDLKGVTDIIKPKIEDVDRFYNNLAWWDPNARDYK